MAVITLSRGGERNPLIADYRRDCYVFSFVKVDSDELGYYHSEEKWIPNFSSRWKWFFCYRHNCCAWMSLTWMKLWAVAKHFLKGVEIAVKQRACRKSWNLTAAGASSFSCCTITSLRGKLQRGDEALYRDRLWLSNGLLWDVCVSLSELFWFPDRAAICVIVFLDYF